MGFFQKTRGAISIFLVIILVPMLTVSALFVDASRVNLSKSVMNSAGDLTMNTALTNYDTVLKDIYGLFATAQDKEDLFAKLENYYRTSIISVGISGTEADTYVSEIMTLLGLISEGETSDLLNMQLMDFSIKEVDNANMANPTIVKSGIVNFMKYRCPINIGLSFLNALNSFSTLSKSTELVEKREEYYTEMSNVMKNCKSAWDFINEYNKNDMLKSDTYFDDFKKEAKEFESKYNDITRKIIKDLYDTQKYANNPASPLKTYSFSYESDANIVEQKKRAFTNAVVNLNDAESKIKAIDYPDGAYDLQYLVQVNRKGLFKNYYDEMENLNRCYQDLIYSIENEMVEQEVEKETEYYDSFLETYRTRTITVTEKVKRDPPQAKDDYDQIFNGEKKEYDKIYERISSIAANAGTKVDTTKTNEEIVEIYNKFTKFVDDLTAAKDNLDKALVYLNLVYDAAKPGGSLDERKNEWSNVTKDSELKNSPLAKQDAAEIKNLSSYLKAEEVKKLIDRLANISGNLGKMLAELDKFSFFGSKLTEIKNYEALKNILSAKIGDEKLKSVPIKETELDSQITSWLEGKYTEGKVNSDWINQSGTEINLIRNKVNFYVFLFTNFNLGDINNNSTTLKNDKGGDKILSEVEKGAEKTAGSLVTDAQKPNTDGSKEKENEIVSKLDLPSQARNDNVSTPSGKVDTSRKKAVSSAKNSLSSLFKNLNKALKDMGVTLRDDIYISDYIMSMFSYDTIEKERQYNPKKSNLMTLTKIPINEKNNFAYRKEVEYIIYGGNNSNNLNLSYGSIFGIRLGFNLIYAFMDSSIRDGAMAIAIPLSAATLGIVPAPLIQVAIIIGLSIAESALDLKDLRDGKPVPLFKNTDTWRMSFTGVVNIVKDQVKELMIDEMKNRIDDARDKLSEFLDKTDEELEEMINKEADKVKQLTDAVESSFDTMITRHANMAIQKVTTLADNAIKEAKLDTKLDIEKHIRDELDKWLQEEKASAGEDDLSYKAKEEAVRIIKDKYIPEILEEFKKAEAEINKEANNTAEVAGKKIADIGVKLQNKIAAIRGDITEIITSTTGKFHSYREKLREDVENSINEGAQKLKDTINEKLEGAFGSSNGSMGGSFGGSTGDTTGMASLLSFQYSDYLRLFTIIGLLANPDAILVRTADVIQCNIQHQQSNDSYRLKKSVAYIETTATVQVKPLFLAIPLFADVESNPKDDANWYTIKYKGIKGY